jgi:signal transduction histidine kinase/ligand-binding sensor domain-containing protein
MRIKLRESINSISLNKLLGLSGHFIDNLIFIIAFVLLFPPTEIKAQKLRYNINHLGTENGLSQGSIYAMHKSPDGIMWFGSLDGLNMFDGQSIRVFKPNENDPYAINGKEIKKIINDSKGSIWIGTDKCLNLYNSSTSSFKKIKFKDLKNQPIETETYPIFVDETNIWVWLSNYGLISYNLKTKQQLFRIHEKGINSNYFLVSTSPVVDSKNNFWILSKEYLIKYNPKEKSISKVIVKKLLNEDLEILNYLVNEKNFIFSTNKGLRIIDRQNGITKSLQKLNDGSNIENIYDIECDLLGNIWVATETQGLLYYNIQTQVLDQITSDNTSSIFNLHSNEIAQVYVDYDGIVWANTDPFGVDQIRIIPGNFDYFKIKKDFSPDNSNYSIRGISIYNGSLYVGTQQAGFFEIDTSNFKIKKQFLAPKIPSNTIRNIFVDSKNRMWIGTTEGLAYLENDKIKIVDLGTKKVTGNFVRTISESNGNIWIGTEEGLAFIDSKNPGKANRVPNLNYRVSLMDQKNDSTAIIGTFEKIILEFDTKRLKIKKVIPINGIPTCLLRFNDSFWIGTSSGVLKTDLSLRPQTTLSKLKDEFIYGLTNDSEGNFWISSNGGIIKYNPKTDQIFRFNQNDGIQASEFNGYSTFKDKNGRIYMGGIRGLNYFHPKEINTPITEPKNILTNESTKIKIKNISYFEESTKGNEIISPENVDFNRKFKTINGNTPNFSYTEKGVWLKFEFRNQTTIPWLLEVFNARLDTLKIWVFERNLPLKFYDISQKSLIKGNEIISPNPAVKLDLIANQDYTAYIYANTVKDLKLPLSLYNTASYSKHQYFLNLIWGIYMGFFLLISIYNIFLFLTIKDPSYLYYSLYILFFGAFQISIYGIVSQYFSESLSIFGNLYFSFLFVSYIFLVLFTNSFLQLDQEFGRPWLIIKKLLIYWSIFWALIPIIVFKYWYNYIAIISGILYTFIFFYISYIYVKKHKPIIYYYGLATLFLAVASTITGFQNLNLLNPDYQEYIIMIGSMLEIVLFSIALGYKFRQNQLEKERQQALRNEISGNLHDDLAASLSSLTMFSELSKRKVNEDTNQIIGRFDLITQKTRDILFKVREAVYELNPSNDSENEWLERILDFGTDIFDSKNIDFKFSIADGFENDLLNPKKRKDIILIFKEIMNNSAKYSEATEVIFKINTSGNHVTFEFFDNGKGFEKDKVKAGNGLNNIFERAKKIKAEINFDSKSGKGTAYKITTY